MSHHTRTGLGFQTQGPEDEDEQKPEEGPVDPEDWRRHKPYGAGIARLKPISFIKAGTEIVVPQRGGEIRSKTPGQDISNYYLNLVFGKKAEGGEGRSSSAPPGTTIKREMHTTENLTITDSSTAVVSNVTTGVSSLETARLQVCEECHLPITDPVKHQHSIAHQSALPHSHPPHHFDRSSQGLKYLMNHGWDPDKRVGLGKVGSEGERWPLAEKIKDVVRGVGETEGLGLKKKSEKGKNISGTGSGSDSGSNKGVIKKKLDAKSARKEAEREQKRRRQLAEYLNRP